MALPNLYTSAAMVLVEPQSVDEDLVDSGVRESDLNERLGLMTAEMLSRSRLSAIIEKFELYRNESGWMQRSEIIELMFLKKHDHSLAFLVQLRKCLHQVALDNGDWKKAWQFLPIRDPLSRPEFSGTPREPNAIHKWQKALNGLKGNKKPWKPDEDAEEEEASTRKHKPKAKGKGHGCRNRKWGLTKVRRDAARRRSAHLE